MPVTLRIVDHPATAWGRLGQSKSSSAEQLLREACPRQYRNCKTLVQTSFARSQFRVGHVTPSENGFVWAAYHAYSNHHHLCIRPEDVWFAILTQLSYFINAHAEELRSFFVAHEGQKELEAVHDVADFAYLAVQMSEIIGKNVLDPELKDWVMPAFSTTTDCDRVVGAILFMGAMQKYFSYRMCITCGLPSVTLLGCVEDWETILTRLDKLELLGDEPTRFAAMLRPILRRMVQCFSDPSSPEIIDFWNTIVHRNSMGSGTDYLSGWLTAFCFWDEDGKANTTYKPILEERRIFRPFEVPQEREARTPPPQPVLDDVVYPTIDVDEIPAGFGSVPVTVDDNGHVYKATMVAGSVGVLATTSNIQGGPDRSAGAQDTHSTSTGPAAQSETAIPNGSATPIEVDGDENVTSSGGPGDTNSSGPGPGQGEPVRDTVQGVSGWWIFENEPAQPSDERSTQPWDVDSIRALDVESTQPWDDQHNLGITNVEPSEELVGMS